jgi:hypothetical protein
VGFEFETVLLDVDDLFPQRASEDDARNWSDGDLREAVAIFDDPAAWLARWRGDAR